MAGTDFTAERQNITILPGTTPGSSSTAPDPYLLSPADQAKLEAEHRAYQSLLQVPRRPLWTSDTTPAQLERAERDAFLAWRKGLAELTDQRSLLLTPFERNLEVWRQLWRVLERSQLIVQIVDARNPLRFRCEDLERYVVELSKLTGLHRQNLLLINKADLLSDQQRELWADYLEDKKIDFAFFSAADAVALQEADLGLQPESDHQHSSSDNSEGDEESEEDGDEEDNDTDSQTSSSSADLTLSKDLDGLSVSAQPSHAGASDDSPLRSNSQSNPSLPADGQAVSDLSHQPRSRQGRTKILTVEELEQLFLQYSEQVPTPSAASSPPSPQPEGVPRPEAKKFVVGLVGYPNVGKSSTINALVGAKKVSVSATPGKTKHFQTIHLSPHVILCDCPGLVFPQFASTKAELVCDGVLPIDQMREFTGPIGLLTRRIPRHILEATYGLQLAPDEEVTALAFLGAYAVARGFFTGGGGQGRPDESRAARPILKDYVSARLLYCEPPPIPGLSPSDFNTVGLQASVVAPRKLAPTNRVPLNADTYIRPTLTRRADALDQTFFNSMALHGAAPVPPARFSIKGRAAQLDAPTRLRLVPREVEGKSTKKHFKGRSKRTKMRSGKGYDEF